MSTALTLSAFIALAQTCAPNISSITLASVVRTETGFHPHSLNVNSEGRSIATYRYATRAAADAALAAMIARGVLNVDIGIAQISLAAGHMQRRNLPPSAAFDPCIGLRVGGDVLAECYRRAPGSDPQARLRAALGCYNTGRLNPDAPYVQRVQASAEVVVPAIQALNPASPAEIARQAQARRDAIGMTAAVAPCAPAWDGWALAACQDQPAPAAPPDPHPTPQERTP